MTRGWESALCALDIEEDDREFDSAWTEKGTSPSQPSSPERGSMVFSSTITEGADINPTGPEKGTGSNDRVSVYPNRLLPVIPEEADGSAELPQQPTDAQEQPVAEDDGPDHILGGRWRRVADESKKLFDKRRGSGYYSLQPELRREVLRCHRHLGHMPRDQLARVLADAGAKPEVIEWTKRHFECPVCKATIKPGLPRPAAARKQTTSSTTR